MVIAVYVYSKPDDFLRLESTISVIMRRFPALLILLGAFFTLFSASQANAVNETRITSLVVSGVNATVSWSTSEKQKNTVYQVEVTDKSKTKNNLNTIKTPSSTIVIKDLKAWNQYSIRIRSVVGSRTYTWSKPVLFLTTQNSVTDLAVTSVSYRTATVNWTAVPGSSGYKLYLDGIAVSVVQATSFELKNLLIGKNYAVSVSPINGALEGLKSVPAIFTTLNISPQNLVNTSTTNTTAKFEWSAIAGVDDYEMYLDDKLIERIKTNNYEFKNLTPGQAIVIKVIGRFGDQKTEAAFAKSVLKKEVPTSLKLIEATSNSLKFEWVGSSNFSKYNVYVDGLRSSTTTTPSYTVTGLARGQAISIYVTGVEKDVESSASETLKANTPVTTPAAPTVVVANAVSARISWTQDLAAKNFIVNVYDGVKAAAVVTNTVVGTATSTVVTGLLPGTSYTATITIEYGSITTSASPVTAFSTSRPAPTGLATSGVTTTAVTLTWDAVPGALRYEYSRDGLAAVNVANATSVVVSSLSPGVSYSFKVRAVFTAEITPTTNLSDYSSSVSITTLADVAFKPTISSAPTISVSSPYTGATAIVGASLVATSGIWTATPAPTSYTYQWQRSYDAGTNWTSLQGATSSTYLLVETDYGFKLRVGVTATNTNGSTTSYSGASDTIGTISNIQIPIARGTLVVGQLLSATQGTWYSADPLSYSYAWLRNGSAITNATSATYTLVDADIGTSISVQVTARSSLGSLAATSAARGSVPAILNTEIPTVSGTTRTAETLTATNGTWLNSPGSYTYQWEQSSDGTLWDPISSATSSTYVLASGQVGKLVRVQVRASKTVSGTTYTEVVYSAATASITGTVTGLVISNTVAPVVTGSWTEGAVLTTSNGSWSATGTFTYKWQRSTDASTWSDISGASASTYTIVSADAGNFIRSVVAINSSTGAGTAYSASTRKVGAPYNTVAAAVTGTVRVGSTQTTTNGTWTNSPTSYSYQWQSSANGIAWTNIGSATNSTYSPTFAQANLQIRVIVTATNAVDTATVTSNVVSGFLPPEATAIPTVTGTTTVGQTLTAASPGTWAGSPSAGSYAYQWQKSTDGVTWTNISAATATTYVLVTGDAGYLMRVQVSLSTNAGTSVAYSLATAAVASS